MPILTDEERVGTVIARKYRLRALLARGGMGVLFAGEHTWTRRPVAIKLLHPSANADATLAQRFLREGRAATALRHPHVVDVLDMGETDDGALFMALELLVGADLGALRSGRAFDPREAVALMSPIVDALAAAHALGIVHRDIKPSNVFIARQGDGGAIPKLLDFGIAKALGEGDSGGTKSGVIVGTPHYMSPEQAEGVVEVGPATDTWALGVVLYELISGALPYDATSPTAILLAVLQKQHLPLVDVAPRTPPALAAAIERALAKDPADRPSDLRAWIAELRSAVGLSPLTLPLAAPVLLEASVLEVAGAHSPTDPPPAPAPIAARSVQRPRAMPSRLWVGIGALALVLVVAVVAIVVSSRASEPVVRSLPLAAPPTSAIVPATALPAPPPTTAAPPPASEAPPESDVARTPRAPRPTRAPATTTPHGHRPITTITTEW
jgi:serine/threonine-protein kinase